MRFTRELTADELKVLGDNPTATLNKMIDEAFRRVTGGVSHRILSILSETEPMTAKDIMTVHNAVFGETPITIKYTRFVVAVLVNGGVVRRKSRGKYLK